MSINASFCPQPYKGLIDPKAMARVALGEALTNLVWARVTRLEDVKASVNWMYAGALGGPAGRDAHGSAFQVTSCLMTESKGSSSVIITHRSLNPGSSFAAVFLTCCECCPIFSSYSQDG